MYNLIRKIHLFAAFVLASFIMMYFVSGFVMIFEEHFIRKPVSEEKTTKLISHHSTTNNDSLVQLIQQNFGVKGQYNIRRNEQLTTVTFRHPGTYAEAKLKPNSDTVTLILRKGNSISILHDFHRIHGYRGGWQYYAWAFMYDLSALSMIVFAITGVYLWLKVERRRLAGWLVLIAFTAFTACTIIYLMYR